MKEILIIRDDGSYIYSNEKPETGVTYIEIPEGAVKAYLNNSNTINFINADDDYMNGATNGEWVDTHRGKHEACGHIIIWQRHTQPEELPFVDDGDYDKSDCDSKLGNFVVDDTLSQRQSQYGEFKEVASTTQYLLQMLSNDKMSDVQLESLHMICSKLSRIAHGDPNNIDSWHDIAGYATLVVKDIS